MEYLANTWPGVDAAMFSRRAGKAQNFRAKPKVYEQRPMYFGKAQFFDAVLRPSVLEPVSLNSHVVVVRGRVAVCLYCIQEPRKASRDDAIEVILGGFCEFRWPCQASGEIYPAICNCQGNWTAPTHLGGLLTRERAHSRWSKAWVAVTGMCISLNARTPGVPQLRVALKFTYFVDSLHAARLA